MSYSQFVRYLTIISAKSTFSLPILSPYKVHVKSVPELIKKDYIIEQDGMHF